MLLAMQVGIGLLMDVWFTRFMFAYLFWVPWGSIFAARGNAATGTQRAQRLAESATAL
jgi:hypothetical protein